MDKLLNVKELGAWLNLPIDRIYALSREGVIPTIRFKRTLRFSREAVLKLIDAGGKGLD